MEQGGLIVGNLRINIRPDVYTAGSGRIERMQKERPQFKRTVDYARNRLAVMVRKGNPKNVRSLEDLGRPDVRVSMPNPQWEGIATPIEAAYMAAGGRELVNAVMETKVKDGTTCLTHIHHRQTPLRILAGESDAGPVWYTESRFQETIGHPIETIEIPDRHNQSVTYAAASFSDAPHPEAADAFLNFLMSDKGQSIYRKYGFEPPPAAASGGGGRD